MMTKITTRKPYDICNSFGDEIQSKRKQSLCTVSYVTNAEGQHLHTPNLKFLRRENFTKLTQIVIAKFRVSTEHT